MDKIFLKDYQKPNFSIDKVFLQFDLFEDHCLVKNNMQIERLQPAASLHLDGVGLELVSIKLNGKILSPSDYTLHPESLTLTSVPESFTLEIETKIEPQKNTSLEGLYKVNNLFCTQCEAQGFRKITYFLDRPDVMTTFEVNITADKIKYPILLSNGNRKESKDLPNGRHSASWQDPFKKPCYLFALVAGDLGLLKDHFITQSGRKVNLEIYAAHGEQNRCLFAMESLKKSMKWDEQTFGREYDLDDYMIVVTDDFNAGAMENKGLNVFNSRFVLADFATATDEEFEGIEAVVAHEYFHNWTGNRVTLRDWFHLSLKEGLTVFRDQEFSADMTDRGLQRIKDVESLRERQFPEDAGPNAHPVRPEFCYAVDNFFTPTIYEKGAEVIRMMQTLVGKKGFRKGMDLYFERHDGQAVIIEDFAAAIADANNIDLSQFKTWYSQAGTPVVEILEEYQVQSQKYSLKLTQSNPKGAENNDKPQLPFHIPIRIGLYNKKGQELKIKSDQIRVNSDGETLIELKDFEQTITFSSVSEKPVLSFSRGFSAPINIKWEADPEDLYFLARHDSDAFNRFEAYQKIKANLFCQLIQNSTATIPESFIEVMKPTLDSDNSKAALNAFLLDLPSDLYLVQNEKYLLPKAFLQTRWNLISSIGENLKNDLAEAYGRNLNLDPQDVTGETSGRRALRNKALHYLALSQKEWQEKAFQQFRSAKNMSDQIESLNVLCHVDNPYRMEALDEFFHKWKDNALVINKWLSIQAGSMHKDTFQIVQRLEKNPIFRIQNPNNVYSVFRNFGQNLVHFHDQYQSTYTYFLEKIVEIDALNPQVAARLCKCFEIAPKLPETQKVYLQNVIRDVLKQHKISKNSFELLNSLMDK